MMWEQVGGYPKVVAGWHPAPWDGEACLTPYKHTHPQMGEFDRYWSNGSSVRMEGDTPEKLSSSRPAFQGH